GAIRAQERMGFAYYDLDRLYDTIPSLFYDDADHTPQGRLRWNGERYRAKIDRVAETIDGMAMPLVGLYGVETEAVVRDLAGASRRSYCYVHRTLNSLDGMDFALLYFGDRFFPERVESGRGYLCVEGLFDGRPLAVLLVRGERFLAELVGEVRQRCPGVRILCAGKLSAAAAETAGLEDLLAPVERRGRGNSYFRGGWRLHDRILADDSLRAVRADVHLRREWLDERSGTPRPTYRGSRYVGGAGRYFPLFSYIERR
ncbi:MAG: hypothetical protein K2H69_06525, partial [Alistipes sp.]|nr:hypothetical protein [Alistipes sp.]